MDFFYLVASGISEGSVLDVAQSYDAVEVINRAIAYSIIASALLSVVFIFYGGITFILSGGDEGKIQQAVSTIRYAIVGLIITMMSVIIVGFIGRALGINAIQYINLNEIFAIVSDVTSGTGGGGDLNSLD